MSGLPWGTRATLNATGNGQFDYTLWQGRAYYSNYGNLLGSLSLSGYGSLFLTDVSYQYGNTFGERASNFDFWWDWVTDNGAFAQPEGMIYAAPSELATWVGPGGLARAYSVAYEVKLGSKFWKASRSKHFKEANKILLEAIDANPELAKMMNQLIPDIRKLIVGPRGGISRISPGNWTWHHATEPGVLQLVPTSQHTSSSFWKLFHPGGKGGHAIWGR